MTINDLLLSSAEKLLGKVIDAQARKVMPGDIVDVVNKHSKLAAGAGLVPVPGADFVMGTANTVKMFKGINSTLGISNDGIALKSLTSTLLSSLATRFATAGITSSLKFIPGVGQVAGGLVSALMQYMMALTSGYIYFNALSLLVDDQGHISLDKLGDAMKRTMANKEVVDAMVDTIKSNASQLFTTVKDNVSSWSSTAADSIGSATKSVVKGAGELYETASGGIGSAASSVADVASSAADSIKSGTSAAIDKAGYKFNSIGKSISDLWAKKKKADK